MYHRNNSDQVYIDDFFLPFGGKLRKDNRWVRMAAMMPWEYIDEVYARNIKMVPLSRPRNKKTSRTINIQN